MNPLGIPHEATGLVAALTVGLLIGLERGWHERELPEGGRVAGLRTFALTAFWAGSSATCLRNLARGRCSVGCWAFRFCSQCLTDISPNRPATLARPVPWQCC
ncbi:MgtC/SapB family protein [Cupriavidus sp. UYPR2.512]|uniref:MgtC/SapB family protein n=1 Tax=Cupriavidus sp. UYPR2.512 TaxID=1080187 RepID=UPI0009D9CA8F